MRPTQKKAPFYKRWWFWTAVGVVVVGATTATIVATRPGTAEPYPGTLGIARIP